MLQKIISRTSNSFTTANLLSRISRNKSNVTVDGNAAAAYIAYALTDIGFGYPITPSSSAFEVYEKTVAKQTVNSLNMIPSVTVMHSEGGVAAALHGCAENGGLTSSFTSCQGLALMYPEFHKMSTSGLPIVVHVASRALTKITYNIFADHTDVMPVRTTGVGMVVSGTVQEVHDLGLASHLASIKSRLPVVHWYDGFRTSHEMSKIERLDYDEIAKNLVDWNAITEFRRDALSPERGQSRIGVVNNDVGMQWGEAVLPKYDKFFTDFQDSLDKIAKLTGRQYHAFDYFGAKDAKHLIIIMGSASGTAEEAVDYLVSKGEKVGLLKVRLYRPWSNELLLKAIPKSVEKIAVLDRTRENGSYGEPLYLDVVAAFSAAGDKRALNVINGIYGIGGKEFTPPMVESIFQNIKLDSPMKHFTVGIVDDVNKTSLPLLPEKDMTAPGTKQCIFWGLAADGTVGANQEAISIISEATDLFTQGYFLFEAKKSGGWTMSHLRFGPKPITAEYSVQTADYLAVHQPTFLNKFPHVFDRIKKGGIIVVNTPAKNLDDFNRILPPHLKRLVAERDVKIYNIDASSLARSIGLDGHINMLMQTAFFVKIGIIPAEKALNLLSDAVRKAYKHKGPKVIDKNLKAVDVAKQNIVEINYNKAEWLKYDAKYPSLADKFPDADPLVKDIFFPTMAMEGDSIPVSKFVPVAHGKVPNATSVYEKRNLSHQIPVWDSKKCDTCNQCVAVCPHGVIRSYLLTEEEAKAAPKPLETRSSINVKGYEYTIQLGPYDCMGCTLCAEICGRDAMKMKPRTEVNFDDIEANYQYARGLPNRSELARQNLRGVAFRQPLQEYPGSCMGCTQTIYQRLITQLYGHRMAICNPANCSVVYGSYFPSMPYVNNPLGHGPAFQSTLFEDGAEVSYGMAKTAQQRRAVLLQYVNEALKNPSKHQGLDEKGIALLNDWIKNYDNGETSYKISNNIKDWLKSVYKPTSLKGNLPFTAATFGFDHPGNVLGLLYASDDLLTKQSFWTFCGDGYAYDIGYGGLDHVLSDHSTDLNVLVMDNEFYANTGYQVSKSTNHGANAVFSSLGRLGFKKDMGGIFMNYGHIYIGSICFGANPTHALKCITEAEAYPGPSLILAYSPCMGHNIEGTMAQSLKQQRLAVKSGYWNLYSYNPLLKKQGKNPFVIASKKPTVPVSDFLYNEGRYTGLKRDHPALAETLHKELQVSINERWHNLEGKLKMFEGTEKK